MPKSTKRFIISNSGLNGQGFRMLTEGAALDAFELNPLMLFNHQRPEGTDKNQILPIGHWEDIEVNGDEISGVPVFDDKDDFAMSIYHKVEGGHIRMCSAGAEPLETSSKAKDLLPGQTKATVTKWRLKEASICDIGANPGSLAVALYDSKDNLIRLSDSFIKNLIPNIMAKKVTTAGAVGKAAAAKKTADAAMAKAIKLTEDAEKLAAETGTEELSEEDPEEELADDTDKDATIEKLNAKIAELEEQLKAVQDQLSLAADAEEETKAETLANKALALRKITLAEKPHIIKLAKADYKGTVEYLNSKKATPSIKDTLENAAENKTGNDAKLVTLSAKSWDELFNGTAGELSFIKLHAPDVYKAKYKEKFKKDPKN